MNYSLVIPYYKAADFLDDALNSALSQSVPPSEVLIIDDEVSLESKSFLAARATSTIRIITLPQNGGVANARNVGVKAALHEWIAFLDADDLWEPEKIRIQEEYLAKNPDWIGCHTGVKIFGRDGRVIAEYNNKPAVLRIEDLLMGSHVTPPSLLIKKDVLMTLGGMNTTFTTSSDYEFSVRLVKAGYKLGFVPQSLIRVRRQMQGNLSSNWHKTFRNHLRLMLLHRDVFIGKAGYSGARKFLAKSIRESSGKLGGFSGRLLYQVGKLLDPSSV